MEDLKKVIHDRHMEILKYVLDGYNGDQQNIVHEKAILIPPQSEPIKGRDAIVKAQLAIAEKARSAIEATTIDVQAAVKIGSDYVVERARTSATLPDGGTRTGNSLLLWKMVDGAYVMVVQMSN